MGDLKLIAFLPSHLVGLSLDAILACHGDATSFHDDAR
jgi:hypothetical protein